jgi:hypothetical protein
MSESIQSKPESAEITVRPDTAEVAAVEQANEYLIPEHVFQNLLTKTGNWRVKNNILLQADPSAPCPRTFVKKYRWMDCRIKANVRVDTADNSVPSSGIRIIVRANEMTDTFYTVGFWVGNSEVRIEKSQGLTFETLKPERLAIANFPLELGKTYALTVVVDHATIYCYIDGEFIAMAQEPDFTTQPVGRVGFMTKAATGMFCDVSVKGFKGITSSPFLQYDGNPLNVTNYAPAVLKDDKYRMWDGYNELPSGAGRYAESPDGITWHRPVGVEPVVIKGHPGEWPEGNDCGDPDVIKIDGEYWITFWSTCKRRNGEFDGMGIKRSRDGIHWTPEPANPVFYMGPFGDWDELVVGDHAMIKDGGRFKMWHVGINRSERGYRNEFGYAESEDGIHWRKCRLNPVLTQGKPGTWDGGWIYAAGIVKIDDQQIDTHVYAGKSGASYHLFYTGQPTNNERICGVKRIGYAFSLDGIHWVKWKNPATTETPFQDSDPVVSWSKYGQTGYLGVGAATAILVDDEVRLYYSMYDNRKDIVQPEGVAGTGLATVKVDTLRNIVADAKAKGLLRCASRQEIEAILDDPLPQSMWDDLQGWVLKAVQAKEVGDLDGEKSALAEIAATRAKFTKALDRYYAGVFAPLKKIVDRLEVGYPVTEKVLWSLPEEQTGITMPQIEFTGLNVYAGNNPILIEIEAKCDRFQTAFVKWATEDGFQAEQSMEIIVGYPGVESTTYRVTITTGGQPLRAIRLQFPEGAHVNLKQIRIREIRI